MAKKMAITRRELLNRWSEIQEEDDTIDASLPPSSSKHHRIMELKEEWFSDAFGFLSSLPKESHIWCGHWDIMGPLLETFYIYFKHDKCDSPLKKIWNRISYEMRKCTQCVCQHHQAQEMYYTEYETICIIPLLDVLKQLDEERVSSYLKEINEKVARRDYIPTCDDAEIVCVMFEVLMFPILLDDQFLVTEFQKFMESVDEIHELTLAGHQQYPGVFALLFLNSPRVRSIGRRLAANMGKMRRVADLEPLQPLLKKCMQLLETGLSPSALENKRPRVQLESTSVWNGINALLGFLECSAFEEGILEQYPIFFSLVLNHISEESHEFLHAVKCLRRLFEILGCKLWLRSTFSPSVMRNTLLGQCFHTRNEKCHKEIFDLFQPFLWSLEALQDGEHEEQRRHFIYFLLQQTPVSSNFSNLMRKKACQIALFIVHRGYKMTPPSPPSECAHIWAPSLVSSLKDCSLHNSLRQPAFDLIETIIVSDAAALTMAVLASQNIPDTNNATLSYDLDWEIDHAEPILSPNVEEHPCSWMEFNTQGKNISQEYSDWICMPMLWLDVLVEIDPSVLPTSFSKAVFWARSRFPSVEVGCGDEFASSVRDWLMSSVKELATSLQWKAPTGSDDGGVGKESKNSVKISAMHVPLVRIFKRMTTHFIIQMERGHVRKQWTWEPRIGESLILLLLDLDDNMRQIAKRILEQISSTRGLASGLQFLCSNECSSFSIFVGFKHALRLVQMDLDLLNFRALHNFFFVSYKILKEGMPTPEAKLPKESTVDKYSSEGGFLRQPVFSSPTTPGKNVSSSLNENCLEKFSCLFAQTLWPFLSKCLVGGKAFVNYKHSQMTCVRLLEILPTVLEKIIPTPHRIPESLPIMSTELYDFKWMNNLVGWGTSSLEVVIRYWRQALVSVLDILKKAWGYKYSNVINNIQGFISADSLAVDSLAEHITSLSISLSNETPANFGKPDSCSTPSSGNAIFRFLGTPSSGKDIFGFSRHVDENNCNFDKNGLEGDDVICISDEESEEETDIVVTVDTGGSKHTQPNSDVDGRQHGDDMRQHPIDIDNTSSPISSHINLNDSRDKGVADWNREGEAGSERANTSRRLNRIEVSSTGDCDPNITLPNRDSAIDKDEIILRDLICDTEDDAPEGVQKTTFSNSDSTIDKDEIILRNLMRNTEEDASKGAQKTTLSNRDSTVDKDEIILRNLMRDTEDASKNIQKTTKRFQLPIKPAAPIIRRQVVQLNLPTRNRTGLLNRMESVIKRFKAPNLEDWFRPILEMDYFAAVGISSQNEDEIQGGDGGGELKKVPLSFESPEQYVDVFRPLLLEEFKAKLQNSFTEVSSLEDISCGSLSVMSIERVDDFHILRCMHEEVDSSGPVSCSENDLVLLTKNPIQNQNNDTHFLGKVERREKDGKQKLNILVIRIYLNSDSSRLKMVQKFLRVRTKWFIFRIMSITTEIREFQALSSSKYIPMLPIILKPADMSMGFTDAQNLDSNKLSPLLEKILRSSFNDTQLQAVATTISSLLNYNIQLSLIQGPPGTGKTRTVLAIVSCLLASFEKIAEAKRRDVKSDSNTIENPKPRMSQAKAVSRAWQNAALALKLSEKEGGDSVDSIGEQSTSGRVLICAQSNAAVDELVSRICVDGLYGIDGKMYKPYLVRVGNVRTVHPNSLPFFIDTIVEQRLAERRVDEPNPDSLPDSSASLRSNLEKLVDRIRFFETRRAELKDRGSDQVVVSKEKPGKDEGEKGISREEVEIRLRSLYRQKNDICRELASAQVRERRLGVEGRAVRQKIRRSILREAQIVVTTLSGSGGDLFAVCAESLSGHRFRNPSESSLFDAVVIDEAAQALEPATLIPLQLLKSNRTKCIMVGDPKQLPATVISNIASKYLYQCSMFERLQKAGYPVTMLTTQYRMHPEICHFPSLHFYDGKLLNGDMTSSLSTPFHKDKMLGPYLFFDVVDGRESRDRSGSMSLYNEREVDASVEILRFFEKRYPGEFKGGRIGVITPYKRQLSILRTRFAGAFGHRVTGEMEFNTVDGFQGREVDILLLSTVRASNEGAEAAAFGSGNIGFVADVRRMNVALTRAKLSLWLFGNARTLQKNSHWAALLSDARKRNLLLHCKTPYASLFYGPASHTGRPVSEKPKNVPGPGPGPGSGPIQGEKVDPKRKGGEGGEETRQRKRPRVVGPSTGTGTKSPDPPEGRPGNSRDGETKRAGGVLRKDGCKEKEQQEKKKSGKGYAEAAKRRQQREAVDELLSSALISSKKPQPATTSSRPSQRAAPRGEIQPPIIKKAAQGRRETGQGAQDKLSNF